MAKILIIDDDPTNRDILKTRLEHLNHDVLEAKNGEEGLALIDLHKPALVLLDVMMPRVDGWQVCKTIKGNPKTKNIPVVILTALSQNIDELHAYESGADDYLAKPCEFKKLQDTLSRFLSSNTPVPNEKAV